jgi:aminoglycoside phosphotransferase (APT) family kinase protein
MTALPMHDPTAAAEALARWFALRHPGSGELSVHHRDTPLGGYSNLTWPVTVDGPLQGFAAPVDCVVRLQSEGDGVFPDNDVARQFDTLQRLGGSGLPVPAVHGFEPDARVLGAPFYVMSRIAGRVPNENPLYHLEGWLHDLRPEEQAGHWRAGLSLIARISRVDWRASGLAHLGPNDSRAALRHQLDAGLRHVRWAESLGRPYPLLHAAHRWLVANAPGDEPVVLQWGDAKLGNCVFDDGALVGALDWETASLGSPVADLAWWLMHDEALSAGYGVPRLAGLPGREASIAHWEQASGYPAATLPYHEVMAAWRFATIMARIGTIFMQRGWVPGDSAMDLDNGAAAVLARLAGVHGF